jgi:hypothetical protein
MIKKFFKISFYAFVAFSTVNMSIILLEILLYSQIKEVPHIILGFPLKFYSIYQYENLKMVYYLNYMSLFTDYILFWIIVFFYSKLKTSLYKKQIND